MNNIDKEKNNSIDNNKLDVKISKKIEEKKVINDEYNKISELAEKIVLNPIKKWLEWLKSLILPEKTKKEINEKLSTLDINKNQESIDVLGSSNKLLKQFKQEIKTPAYYIDYAKKWTIETAQIKSVESLIQKVSDWKNDPNLIARWMAYILNQLKRYN